MITHGAMHVTWQAQEWLEQPLTTGLMLVWKVMPGTAVPPAAGPVRAGVCSWGSCPGSRARVCGRQSARSRCGSTVQASAWIVVTRASQCRLGTGHSCRGSNDTITAPLRTGSGKHEFVRKIEQGSKGPTGQRQIQSGNVYAQISRNVYMDGRTLRAEPWAVVVSPRGAKQQEERTGTPVQARFRFGRRVTCRAPR